MERFNSQHRRVLGAGAVTAALLVPLGIFGGPALARSASSAAEYQYGPSGKQYKVTICHHTHSTKHPTVTISVAAAAVKAHLRHHDSLGACPETAGPQSANHGKAKGKHKSDQGASTQQQPTSGNQGQGQGQGQGNDHGNAGGNGNGNAGGNGKGKGK